MNRVGPWSASRRFGSGGLRRFDADGLEEGKDGGVLLGILDAFVDERLDAVLAELDLGESGLGAAEFPGELNVLKREPGHAKGQQCEQARRPQKEQIGLHAPRFIGGNDEAKAFLPRDASGGRRRRELS